MNDANGNESYERLSAEEETRMKEFRDWLAFAQTDYDSAEYLSKAPFHPNTFERDLLSLSTGGGKGVKGFDCIF